MYKAYCAAYASSSLTTRGTATQAALLAIGTPVRRSDLSPIGCINEDAIGGLATGVYQSASIFRDEDEEHHDTIFLVRQSEAQAQIAARDAEIVRLREALDRIRLVPFPMMDLPAGIMHGIAHKSLKGGAA